MKYLLTTFWSIIPKQSVIRYYYNYFKDDHQHHTPIAKNGEEAVIIREVKYSYICTKQ